MGLALRLAARGIGQVAPNPAVGCVIIKQGIVLGRGWTQPGGRPHAETVALDRAGSAAQGATVYVSLEPCAHQGKSPPCADALILAGVSRVVFPIRDPDERVNGAGKAKLERAGIEVVEGVGEVSARRLLSGFISRIVRGRPHVTLKLASSVDGRIATRNGESQWITGEEARRYAHLLRAQHDAILIGVGTVKTDNPALTCRLPGLEGRSPVRVILDSHLVTPIRSDVVKSAREIKTMIIAGDTVPDNAIIEYLDMAVEVHRVALDRAGKVSLFDALKVLGNVGITNVLIESGSALAASFISTGLVDRLMWFRASNVIGGDGLAAVADLFLDRLALAPRFDREAIQMVGEDIVETFRHRP